MNRAWYLRFSILVALVGLAIYALYPSYYFFFKATPEQQESREKFCAAMPSWMTCNKLTLGLDLQGGVHLVMGVRVDKAIEHRLDRVGDALRESLKEKNISFTRLDRARGSSELQMTLAPGADTSAVEDLVRKDFTVLEITGRGDGSLRLGLLPSEAKAVTDAAVDQAIKTIRNRADKLGVTEPTIARRGTDNILIQLPGVKDPDRALDVIGRTAQLEFKMVDSEGSAIFDEVVESTLPEGVTRKDYSFEGPNGRTVREVYFELPEAQKDALVALLDPQLPEGRELAFGDIERAGPVPPAPGEGQLRTYLLEARAGITGDYLVDARVEQDREMATSSYVTMTFDQVGARIFEKLTMDNVHRHMAIVLDGKVNSAPVIQEKIGGGTARITLGGGMNAQLRFQEAKDLALVLKAGALPAPVEIREKRQVGKTLGQDTVRRGSIAMAIGCLLVIAFIAFYYRGSGMLANIALALNALFLLAILATIEATLTLPGMAGIALTIGMAVDANVIIFERIREELTIGKTVRAAIDAGYAKAFTSIFDSNITTVIAAVVLMQYGSGPVRGFAVTLIIGITCSMYTAIVATRMMFDFFTSRSHLQTLSI